MKVLVIFGGESSEHAVSVMSARNITGAVRRAGHEVELIFISRAGRWFQVTEVREYGEDEMLTEVVPVLGQGRLVNLEGRVVVRPEVIFAVLHGENGEDGAMAALGQLLHVPVVGCDMFAGSLCMDKVATKRVLEYVEVKTAKFLVHSKEQPVSFEAARRKLGAVMFVKPTRTGSSVGVSKVRTEAEWRKAIDLAMRYGETVLVEAAVAGAREIEVAVMGNEEVRVSVPGEIVPDREFYDYESKYDDSSTSEAIIPAKLDKAAVQQIQEWAGTAYRALGCAGLARVDFLVGSDGEVILNEVNTLPGFTDISMYPKLWEAEGVGQEDLVEELLRLAMRK
jgi:D-alanine-D-alanine ligase